jgi:hypothetical protein
MLAPGWVCLYSFTNAARAASYQTTSGAPELVDFADAADTPRTDALATLTPATARIVSLVVSERPRQSLWCIRDLMVVTSLLPDIE